MFDRYQFQEFYTPLCTLISTSFNLSFYLDTYENSIQVDVHTGNITGSQREAPIRLNINRADLIDQSAYQVIFIAVREGLVIESYVDCKRMDSHFFKSINGTDPEADPTFEVHRMAVNVEHRPIESANKSELEEFFAAGPCKSVIPVVSTGNQTTAAIDQPLIGKMQLIIDKIRQRTK